MLNYGLIAALMYALPFVMSDSLSKRMVSKLGGYTLGTLMLAIGLIPTLIAAAIVGFGSVSLYVIAFAVITGVSIAMGYILLYKAMETEQISNSIAFSELGSAIFVIFGFVVFGEAISSVGILGIIILFLGAGLVAITEDLKFNRKLIPAMIAFILFSGGFIFLAYSIKASGTLALPLIITRLTALVFFFFVAGFVGLKKTKEKAKKHIKGIVATGILDSTGTIAFGFATVLAAVGLSGVINATVPVIAAVIGYKYYKERFTNLQLFGFTIMVAGALIVSIV